MRLILSLVLPVILTLAASADAVARSEMAGASDQIVCGAQGSARIMPDAFGHLMHRPTCSHCLVAAVSADLPGLAARPDTHALRQQPLQSDLTALARSPTPVARGPPPRLV